MQRKDLSYAKRGRSLLLATAPLCGVPSDVQIAPKARYPLQIVKPHFRHPPQGDQLRWPRRPSGKPDTCHTDHLAIRRHQTSEESASPKTDQLPPGEDTLGLPKDPSPCAAGGIPNFPRISRKQRYRKGILRVPIHRMKGSNAILQVSIELGHRAGAHNRHMRSFIRGAADRTAV